ncbi:MAG TPA: 2-phospho-L-lactate guanylyltransferase [Acidimicrobiaceae bacterium]|nr:2-phospho-L-lactate guanylyltransferase [Acidimicrobiaceae bacterium]HBU39507.1 2-phospho-L-lactate guanylyltransferase [Acidimicrobiaceae bacterium]|tara:strand:- start:2693 stop:3298 length:606 start_codon:yes stop_codon:yes gene_type:complete
MAASNTPDHTSVAVIVPIKDFRRAKHRLSDRLDAQARESLARSMAERVLSAAKNFTVHVACNDDEVANWATSLGAQVIWVEQDGLNPAVSHAARQVEGEFSHMTIVHADLPQAQSLDGIARTNAVSIVPDRHKQGTNVLSLPTGTSFEFQYGANSLYLHMNEAVRRNLDLKVLQIEHLQWDIDTPEDLDGFLERSDSDFSQ